MLLMRFDKRDVPYTLVTTSGSCDASVRNVYQFAAHLTEEEIEEFTIQESGVLGYTFARLLSVEPHCMGTQFVFHVTFDV